MNRITLMGRLGKDPEIKFLPSGTAVCKFTLATSRKWKDQSGGDMHEKTEWHKIVAWGKQGETLGEYVHKGDQLLLSGELRYSEWNDKEGNKRTTAEIHLQEFDFVGSKKGSAENDKSKKSSSQSQDDDVPF